MANIWQKIGKVVSPVAPIIGGLVGSAVPAIGTSAGAVAGQLIASAIGGDIDRPEELLALLQDPKELAKVRLAEQQNKLELQKLLIQAETAQQAEINATMRVEASSADEYVRRWRPTWGYITAYCWAAQTIGVLVICIGGVFATLNGLSAEAQILFNGATNLIGALTVQWSVALAVLGINVNKRSQDKAVAAGMKPPSLFEGMFPTKKSEDQ